MVRRARREDFARVQALVGRDAPAARADRKRFRRLVSTLREDLYLALRVDDGTVEGLVVIAYVRGLGPSTAIVRALRGTNEAQALLLACAHGRAAARGCTRLELHLDDGDPPATDGWLCGGRIQHREVRS